MVEFTCGNCGETFFGNWEDDEIKCPYCNSWKVSMIF